MAMIQGYPINILRWQGDLGKVVSNAALLDFQLDKIGTEPNERLSTNFIATAGRSRDEITLYFAPRNKNKDNLERQQRNCGWVRSARRVSHAQDELALVERGMLDYLSSKVSTCNRGQ